MLLLAGSPSLLIGALSITFSLLAAVGVAWYIGMLDFNFSREPRPTASSGSAGARPPCKSSTSWPAAELLRHSPRLAGTGSCVGPQYRGARIALEKPAMGGLGGLTCLLGAADADGNKLANRSTLESLAELLRQRERATIGGLELGEMLGRGSFGRVYKGASEASWSSVASCAWQSRWV